MCLLYGAGLRINEALSLNIRDIPAADNALLVTGKGNKQRIVPLLPAIRTALATWLKLHPNPAPDSPIFLGARRFADQHQPRRAPSDRLSCHAGVLTGGPRCAAY